MFTLLLCALNPLLFWLFARALFEDATSFGRLEKIITTGFSTLVIAFLLARQVGHVEAAKVSSVLQQVTGLILVFHIIFETARHYQDDLLEARRRLRLYALGVVGVYMIGVTIAEFILGGSQPAGWLATLNALAIGFLVFAITFASVTLRLDLFPITADDPEVPQSAASTKSGIDAGLIAKVISAMDVDKTYRDESLSISALARQLGSQEYLLRRAINQGLGQRNFSHFLNSYRLSEINSALSNPSKAHLPILTLALDAGFNSIGPFNRAFRETYGVTPSQFRRSNRRSTISSQPIDGD